MTDDMKTIARALCAAEETSSKCTCGARARLRWLSPMKIRRAIDHAPDCEHARAVELARRLLAQPD